MFQFVFKSKLFFIFMLSLLSFFINICFFYPIYTTSSLIIPYGLRPFDICIAYPTTWLFLKFLYLIFSFFSTLIFSNFLYTIFSKNFSKLNSNKHKKNIYTIPSTELSLHLGNSFNSRAPVYLNEKSLYQNLLITGTIGSGKTSSAIYPFAEQLISYSSSNYSSKLGMLILDVKGNLYYQILKYVKKYNREQDLITISLNSNQTYNPLDKPNLNPIVLANRLKTILTLFSPNNTESYWLDKVEQVLSECIKICRIYNDGYVTFEEIHKLITDSSYYKNILVKLKKIFINGKLSKTDVFNLLSSINFLEKDFFNLDSRTLSILKSEITRITNTFVSDYSILNIFSPPKSSLTFNGFSDVINNGKIVVLSMNIYEYKNLSKIIATYLKLDFQSEVMNRLKNNNHNFRSVCFICDEFHEYVTSTDSDFFAQSRESKCINIVSTQSYSSLVNSLNNTHTVDVIIQNLVNKLWFRTDDIYTIENIQKQLGKEDKEKIVKSITENASETNFNYLINSFISKKSNISESYSTQIQNDFIYNTNYFTQNLETFTCLSFLSDGIKILNSEKLEMLPYFKKKGLD